MKSTQEDNFTSLRDRIADALRTVSWIATYEDFAEAVIKELGLRYMGVPQRFILGAGPQKLQREVLPDGHYRYVTEWITDE